MRLWGAGALWRGKVLFIKRNKWVWPIKMYVFGVADYEFEVSFDGCRRKIENSTNLVEIALFLKSDSKHIFFSSFKILDIKHRSGHWTKTRYRFEVNDQYMRRYEIRVDSRWDFVCKFKWKFGAVNGITAIQGDKFGKNTNVFGWVSMYGWNFSRFLVASLRLCRYVSERLVRTTTLARVWSCMRV